MMTMQRAVMIAVDAVVVVHGTEGRRGEWLPVEEFQISVFMIP